MNHSYTTYAPPVNHFTTTCAPLRNHFTTTYEPIRNHHAPEMNHRKMKTLACIESPFSATPPMNF